MKQYSYNDVYNGSMQFIGSPMSMTKNIFFRKHINEMKKHYEFTPWRMQVTLWMIWLPALILMVIALVAALMPITILLFGPGGYTDFQTLILVFLVCAVCYLSVYYALWPLSFKILLRSGIVKERA